MYLFQNGAYRRYDRAPFLPKVSSTMQQVRNTHKGRGVGNRAVEVKVIPNRPNCECYVV